MAGTVTQSLLKIKDVYRLQIDWTADAAAATVPDTAFASDTVEALKGLSCYFAITNPGSTAPTADYDITIVDGEGVDVFGGNLGDRSATATEQTVPKIDTVQGPRTLIDTWTFKLANNAVNSATGKLILLFSR